jgi:hypothetical protein
MRTFDTGATRDGDADKLDYEGFLSPLVLRRYAEYMHKHRKQADGNLRDADNWQKGMPRAAYMKSLWRHFMEVWSGWRKVINAMGGRTGPFTEPELQEALCAVLFNVMGLLHELLLGRDVGAEKTERQAALSQLTELNKRAEEEIAAKQAASARQLCDSACAGYGCELPVGHAGNHKALRGGLFKPVVWPREPIRPAFAGSSSNPLDYIY